MQRIVMLIGAAVLAATPVAANAQPSQAGTKPLFASEDALRMTIQGPLDALADAPAPSRPRMPGSVSVGGETLAVMLQPRGLTRRRDDICPFPPIRIRFPQRPQKGSIFAGQKSLKLVTHCRKSKNFQQHVLLEYAAYKIYNRLTPESFNVRLALIDYVDQAGKPIATRYGFFIEDIDDVAHRNGMREAKFSRRFPVAQLSPEDSARYAIFQYMIGNLDWSMRAGPPGDDCCHNSKPIGVGGASASQITPVPYDFDFTGLVNAPYATPPDSLPVRSVRQRHYRGLCRHGAEAMAALPAFRAQQSVIPGLLASIPGMTASTQRKGVSYLEGFFSDIATDEQAQKKLFSKCRGRN